MLGEVLFFGVVFVVAAVLGFFVGWMLAWADSAEDNEHTAIQYNGWYQCPVLCSHCGQLVTLELDARIFDVQKRR